MLNVLGWSTHITQMMNHHTHRLDFHSGTRDYLKIINHIGHNYLRADCKLPVTYTEFSYVTDKYTPNSIEGEYMCFNPRKVNKLPRHNADSYYSNMESVDHIFMCIYAVFSYGFDQAIQDTIMCAILFDFMSYASMRLSENIINGVVFTSRH